MTTTRVRFFDGLFLRQQEFEAEQSYHIHMRRRMSYMLFDGSGVVQLGENDLKIIPPNPQDDKTFYVTAGMAISHRPDPAEGREIILEDRSQTFDLGPSGLDLAEAYVAVHYQEVPDVPQKDVEPHEKTRIRETAVVKVHPSWPDDEHYVRLGRITRADMSVDPSERQTAYLRTGLLGQPPAQQHPPKIDTVNARRDEPGGSLFSVEAHGSHLANARVTVSFPDVTVSDEAVTDDGKKLTFKLDFNETAELPPRVSIRVDTKIGQPEVKWLTIEEEGGQEEIKVTEIDKELVIIWESESEELIVRGTNIHEEDIKPGNRAVGTTVRLVDPEDTTNELALCSNPVVLPGLGTTQQVKVDLPLTGGFSTKRSPVLVQVEFATLKGEAPEELELVFR